MESVQPRSFMFTPAFIAFIFFFTKRIQNFSLFYSEWFCHHQIIFTSTNIILIYPKTGECFLFSVHHLDTIDIKFFVGSTEFSELENQHFRGYHQRNPVLWYKHPYRQRAATRICHGLVQPYSWLYRLQNRQNQNKIHRSEFHFEEFQYQNLSNQWYFQHKHRTEMILLENSSLKRINCNVVLKKWGYLI